jgi:hypothetical protein
MLFDHRYQEVQNAKYTPVPSTNIESQIASQKIREELKLLVD